MNQTYLMKLLSADERILLITRQHWLVLSQNILADILLLLILTIGIAVAIPLTGPFFVIGILFAVIPIVDMIRRFMEWNSRQFLITNRRVIQISGILSKNVSDSSLEKVNDLKLSQSFMGRLFGYGNVEILTASEMGSNLFNFIGDPVTFKKAMMDAKNRLGTNMDEGLTFRNVVKEQTIPDLIEELDALRIKGILTEEEFRDKKKELLSRM